MAYADIASMAVNAQLQARITACAATEGEPQPAVWLGDNIWTVVASPGWGDAWASGLAGGIPPESIGLNEGVISDGMILSAVQAVRSG
jgi:hypothetical protein